MADDDINDTGGATGGVVTGDGAGGGNTLPPPPPRAPVQQVFLPGTNPPRDRNDGYGSGAISRNAQVKTERPLTEEEKIHFSRSLEILEGELARERDSKVQALDSKTKIENTVSHLVEDVQNLNLDPEGRTAINRLISALAAQGTLPHTTPDFITQVRAPAMQANYDEKGVVSKLIAKIKKFSGTDNNYRWPQFWTQYSIAVQNAAYNRHELRAIFLSCLEGAALAHYQAFLHRYVEYSFEQLVTAFKTRYDDTKEQSLDSVIGKAQASNEDVLTFRDRLLIDAAPFMPEPPSAKTLVRTAEGREILVDNANYEKERMIYDAKKQENDQFIVRFYTRGLRPEIQHKLSTMEYDSLEAATQAAKQAEDVLKALAQARSNHVRIKSVNATYEKQYKGTAPSGKKADGNDKSDCFACGGSGHWIRDCPYRERRRSSSRDRSRSRGRSHSRDRNYRQSTGEKFQVSHIASLEEEVRSLKEEVKKVCAIQSAKGKGGRNRKRGGKPQQRRQPSKSPARSAHGRSRSRSRSKSPGRGGRSNSRYSSSKN